MTWLLANWKLVAIAGLVALLATAGLLLKHAWAENGALDVKLEAVTLTAVTGGVYLNAQGFTAP